VISSKVINELNAGPEMDIIVAEQIMGWLIETDEPKLRRLQGYFARDEGRRWWRTPAGGWYCEPPAYSSDITAAWQVIEQMNSRGHTLFLSQGSEESKAAFDEPRGTGTDCINERSAPLAICKAALVADARSVHVGDPILSSDISVLATALT